MKGSAKKRFILFITISILVFTLAPFCFGGNKGLIPVRIGVQPTSSAAGEWIAKLKGFYRDEGLDVKEWKVILSGAPIIESVISGKLDIGGGGCSPVVSALSQDPPLKVFMTYAYGGEIQAFVIHADSKVKSPLECKGWKVATRIGTSAHYLISRVAKEKYGIDFDTFFKVINIKPPDAIAAFANREVEAMVYWEPFNSVVVDEKKIGKRLFTGTNEYPIPNYVYTSERFLEESPDAVIAFIRALTRGQRYLGEHPEDAVRLLAKELGQTELIIRSAVSRSVYSPLIPDLFIEDSKALAQFFIARGKITKEPNWEKSFDRTLLERALERMCIKEWTIK